MNSESRVVTMNEKGKERSVLMTLILPMLTLSLYYYYWFYANINELEGYLDFSKSDTSPKNVRGFLILYFVVYMIASFISTLLGPEMLVEGSSKTVFMMALMLWATLGVVLNYKFLKLVDFSFYSMKMEEINFYGMFALYAGAATSYFLFIIYQMPEFMIIFFPLAIIYLVMIQKKLNLLWRII